MGGEGRKKEGERRGRERRPSDSHSWLCHRRHSFGPCIRRRRHR